MTDADFFHESLFRSSGSFGARHGSVSEFAVCRGGAQKQRASAHIAAAGEFYGKQQKLSKNGQQCVEVFARRHAPEQDDFARAGGKESFRGTLQRGGETWLVGIDGHRRELGQFLRANQGLGSEQAARWRDDLHAEDVRWRLRKLARIDKLPAEIEPASKREHIAQSGRSDLHLPRQLKARTLARQHGGALATRMRRRKEKDPTHPRAMPPKHGRRAKYSVTIMSKKPEMEVAGKKLMVSNLDKVLYPETGFTKGQVIDYYIRIAPVLLPHLKNRPITLKRYPHGVDGFFFYEKQCPLHRPDWVKTTEVPSRREEGKIDYCLMNDLPALVWAANLADLELHTFLHRAPAITRPTALAFDLNPGAPADKGLCCRVALWLRAIFESLQLQSFVKTSGSKRRQIYVPLNTSTTYEKTKAFAHSLAQRLEREHPEEVVSRMQKALRTGKVLIDWSQNDEHKTTINVYSLRAKPHPTVSMPVTWPEVEAVAKEGDASRLTFESEAALKRVEKGGDLFEPLLTLKQRLPSLRAIA